MPRDPEGERWPEVYRDTPEVFDCFSRAEDRDGIVPAAIIAAMDTGGRSVLEIGAGTGRWTAPLSQQSGPWIAAEPRAGMLAIGRRNAPKAHWVRSSGEHLPFADRCFERLFAGFVLANLRPKIRERVVAEALRLLQVGGELWLLENHWDDGFQTLRAEAGLETVKEIAPLIERHGFEHVETLESSMEFESDEVARQTLGAILGPRVLALLTRAPQRQFLHRLCLLRLSAQLA